MSAPASEDRDKESSVQGPPHPACREPRTPCSHPRSPVKNTDPRKWAFGPSRAQSHPSTAIQAGRAAPAALFQPHRIRPASILRPHGTLPVHGAGPQQHLPQAGGHEAPASAVSPAGARPEQFVCSDIHSLALPLPSEVFHTVGLKHQRKRRKTPPFRADAAKS